MAGLPIRKQIRRGSSNSLRRLPATESAKEIPLQEVKLK